MEGRIGTSIIRIRPNDGSVIPIGNSAPISIVGDHRQQRLLPWSLPTEGMQNRLLLCFVPPRSAAVGILFLVSIERGTSRRVYHRRPWLSDMSQLWGCSLSVPSHPWLSYASVCRTKTRKTTSKAKWPVHESCHAANQRDLACSNPVAPTWNSRSAPQALCDELLLVLDHALRLICCSATRSKLPTEVGSATATSGCNLLSMRELRGSNPEATFVAIDG